MSRDRQKKKLSVPRSRKSQPDPYSSRILKQPTKRELEDTLRHAVRNQDFDALEDYDETLRPPVGAVNTGQISVEDILDADGIDSADWGYDWSADDDELDWDYDDRD